MASKPKRIAFSKLLNAMRRLSIEVNDNEICKRLEVLLLTSKEDLPMSLIKTLIESPLEFEPKDIQEPYTQYVRHFIYMVKRNERMGNSPLGYGTDADSSTVGVKKAKSKSPSATQPSNKSETTNSDVKQAKKKKTAAKKKKP
ncbi:MAG: hypothetical protein MH321_10225 [Leptospiraceae bacterium]|nr:hypothetical protein [Leptospiraceae bacterium]